jgi:hypothetical protein
MITNPFIQEEVQMTSKRYIYKMTKITDEEWLGLQKMKKTFRCPRGSTSE